MGVAPRSFHWKQRNQAEFVAVMVDAAVGDAMVMVVSDG